MWIAAFAAAGGIPAVFAVWTAVKFRHNPAGVVTTRTDWDHQPATA